MQVFVDRIEFEEALSKAKSATERKSALPVLNNFKLTADEDRLYIYATDLENFLVFDLPARVEIKGETSVNANKIQSIVKNLSSAEVYMELVEDKLIVKGGRSQFKLVCADPFEFPEFPQVIVKDQIPSSILSRAISKVEYAVSKEETRYALQGMYVRNHDGRLHFVGSDGHRLALFMPEQTFEDELLLSRKSLKVLEKLLKDTIGAVSVGKDENFAHVKGENWTLSVRLLEGEYPDYLAVIPSDFRVIAVVDREDLEKSLKRLSAIASASAFPVKLSFTKDLLLLEISEPEFGEGKDEVDIDYSGEPIEIGFNGKYILEALDSFDSDRIYIKAFDADSPVIFESVDFNKDPYLCLIMPMRL
ncbi:DNA polymerase III subunit beta [Thermocrinis jamiesonii]|uniref:DNA polymerase III subunit beta n=1 Tax=Thermocrinis jamiesonii TaxID=1302351 RepID=UPI0004966ECB|nr:DNA polymerase III subunit beta [Thermocrinis jamiesonii]